MLKLEYIMQGFAQKICWTQFLSDSKLEWTPQAFQLPYAPDCDANYDDNCEESCDDNFDESLHYDSDGRGQTVFEEGDDKVDLKVGDGR